MLKIRNLQKVYGNYHALDGLDMEIREGALYGFVGPNGAGKTTTIKIISGLLWPDGGTVEIHGTDALTQPGRLKEKIGYVPDYFGVYDNLKVSEYMEFFASCYGMEGLKARKRSQTLLDQVGLGHKLDFYVDGLSRGMKQRLCLARALLHEPVLLVMDEPAAGLDPRTRLEFKETVRELNEQGMTILISSHLLSDLAELCTDVGIVDAGKMLLTGSVEEVIEKIHTSKPVIITVHENIGTAIGILKEHPLVRSLSVKDQEIMVQFAGSGKQESRLLTELISAGVQVRGFMREPGSLEAVFMQLTGREEERVVQSYEHILESGL
ncbi:MAG: ABC transporter ATP-binding protein [Lachnospiraceae bacterium]|jgi:ABC-2 type transport system ATP-binding protein|nr:ABC transporter ATP-binding protein [Lachnospiraceae bacterium]